MRKKHTLRSIFQFSIISSLLFGFVVFVVNFVVVVFVVVVVVDFVVVVVAVVIFVVVVVVVVIVVVVFSVVVVVIFVVVVVVAASVPSVLYHMLAIYAWNIYCITQMNVTLISQNSFHPLSDMYKLKLIEETSPIRTNYGCVKKLKVNISTQ